jgi:siroheme synthase-like protein
LCDFYYPAVVKRGALQIAISTGAESPALAHRLRKELEAQFGPEYEDWLAELGEARKRIREEVVEAADQKAKLHESASEASFQQFLKRQAVTLRESRSCTAPRYSRFNQVHHEEF